MAGVGFNPFFDSAGLLNELGEQGWELAGINGSSGGSNLRLYLKRPRE